MNQVLSDAEMSALLEGVEKGDIDLGASTLTPSAEVRPMDFERLERIDPASFRSLEIVQARFGDQLRRCLGAMLLRIVAVQKSGPVMQHRYGDYVDAIEEPSCLNVIAVEPRGARGLLIVDRDLVCAIVDQYFGGSGAPLAAPREELSPVEQRINQFFVADALEALESVWAPVMPMQLRLLGTETDPRYATIGPTTELILAAEFDIDLGGSSGRLRLVLPESALAPIKHRLRSGVFDAGGEARESSWRPVLERSLLDVKLPLCAALVDTTLSLRRVAALRAGDMIDIPQPENVILRIHGVPVASAAFGDSQGRRAVSLNGRALHP